MDEMMKMYARNGMAFGADDFPLDLALKLNTSNAVIAKLSERDEKDAEQIADYVYRLACLASRKLSTDEMRQFLEASFTLLGRL